MTISKTQNNFYVYGHYRPLEFVPFYVGKGRGNRAFDKNRNKYWKRIVKKYGYTVSLIFENLTEEEAFRRETTLIQYFKDQGGCETNFSLGGEGSSGYKWTESQKESHRKLQASNKPSIVDGHKGQAAKLKGRTKTNHPGVKTISERNSGEGNGRAVWNIITPDGEFATIRETAKFYKISTAAVHKRISSKSERFKNWRKESK